MKIKTIINMLLVCGIVFNATAAYSQFASKTLKLDKDKFASRIKYILNSQVVGYQAVLLKDGKIVVEAAGGFARREIDGEQMMTVNTPSNIGSTAKFFAGTALLKLLSAPKGAVNPDGKSFEARLDDKIIYSLPDIWRYTMDPSWRLVTFRQLLQHKSGVRGLTDADSDNFKAKGYREKSPYIYLLKPIKDADRNKRVYQNFNFTILTYLIPLIADPTLKGKLNEEIKVKKLKVDDLYITQRLGNEFEKYMRANSFGKITPKIAPSCDAPNEYPKQNKIYAKAYKSMTDGGKGFEWSEREENGSCYAQGGWYLSSRELAAFAANFDATETLVSKEVKTKMFDNTSSATADNRLVWSTFYTDEWFTKNFGVSRMPAMDGLQEGYRSVLIKMPNGYFALAMINSAEFPPDQLALAFFIAFKDSASFE